MILILGPRQNGHFLLLNNTSRRGQRIDNCLYEDHRDDYKRRAMRRLLIHGLSICLLRLYMHRLQSCMSLTIVVSPYQQLLAARMLDFCDFVRGGNGRRILARSLSPRKLLAACIHR